MVGDKKVNRDSNLELSPTAPVGICVLSPHLGLLDSWLPVLCELKRRHPSLVLLAILPNAALLSELSAGDFIIDCAADVFDRVLCRRGKGLYSVHRSLTELASATNDDRSAKPHRIPNSRTVTRLCYDLPIGATMNLTAIRRRVKLVCFDVAAQKRSVVDEVCMAFPRAQFFSLPHGIDCRLTAESDSTAQRERRRERWAKCVAYILSAREVQTYCTQFGLQRDNVKVVGVTRHANEWIQRIKDAQAHEKMPSGRYVFVASRPANNPDLLPPDRKRRVVESIRKIATELKCDVIVRRHPKEGDEGIFEEIFGSSRFDGNWGYSSLHPLVLGERALFCITLFSSVAVDMAALGTPTIELCDFRGLAGARQLFRDETGQPISFYQKFGLALAARDYDELKPRAEEILNDRAAIVQRIAANRRSLYACADNPIEVVADDMERAISGSSWLQAFNGAVWRKLRSV